MFSLVLPNNHYLKKERNESLMRGGEERHKPTKVLSLFLCKPCLSMGKRVSQLIIISFKCWWSGAPSSFDFCIFVCIIMHSLHTTSYWEFLVAVSGRLLVRKTCKRRHMNVCDCNADIYKNIIKSKSLAAAAVCPAGLEQQPTQQGVMKWEKEGKWY